MAASAAPRASAPAKLVWCWILIAITDASRIRTGRLQLVAAVGNTCGLSSVTLGLLREVIRVSAVAAVRNQGPLAFSVTYGDLEIQEDLRCPLRSVDNRANVTFSGVSDELTVKQLNCLSSQCVARQRWTNFCTGSRYKFEVTASFDAMTSISQQSVLEYCGAKDNATVKVALVTEGSEVTIVADVETGALAAPKLLSQKITKARIGSPKDIQCELNAGKALQIDGDEVCEPLAKAMLNDGVAEAVQKAIVSGRLPAAPPAV